MKKIITITFLFLLFSCTNTDDNTPGMLEETKQIINDYPDTLESSIKDAKKVTNEYNQNTKELEQKLQEINTN